MPLVNFNTADWNGMFATMDDCKENPNKYEQPFFGTNEDGEDCRVEVFSDRIVLETHQKNDWIRKNIYYRDGCAEELFDGSLIKERMQTDGTICPCCGQYIPPKLREKLKQQ